MEEHILIEEKGKGSIPLFYLKVLITQWIECQATDLKVRSSNLFRHSQGLVTQWRECALDKRKDRSSNLLRPKFRKQRTRTSNIWLWRPTFYHTNSFPLCSFRLEVRTSPFHGDNTGSIPVKNI